MAGVLSLKTPSTGLVTLTPTNTATDKTITLPATTGTVVIQDGTSTATVVNLAYTGTLTGGTGVVNLGSGQFYKDASGNVGIGTSSPANRLDVTAPLGAVNVSSSTGTNYVKMQVNNTGGSFQFAIENSAGGNFGAPAYARVLWNDGAYPTVFYTSSTERMRIDSSGNVGIGTASPTGKLDLFTNATSGSISNLTFSANNASSAKKDYVQFAPTIEFNTASSEAGGYVLKVLQQGAYKNSIVASGITNNSSNFLAFSTTNEAMRIDSSGNVGIGTSSPLAKLQVYPTVGAPASSGSLNTGVIFAEGAGGPSLNMGNFNSGGTYYAWIQSAFVNNAAVVQPLVLQQIGGNVGIGTSSPDNALTIQDSGAGVNKRFSIRNGDSTNNHKLTMGYNAGALSGFIPNGSVFITGETNGGYGTLTALSIGTISATPIIFGTSNSERMQIDTSGNLLVGGTTQRDSAKITCETSLNGLAVYVVPNTNAVDFAIFRANAGTLCGAISRVGTTAAVVYTTTSDYRLKENVMPMTGALDRVAALKPVTFTWKNGGVDAEGFIAHEFAEVCPHGVIGEKDGVDENANPKYQAMDSSVAIPILTAAIQEQQALIQSLTTRLNALEGN